MKHTPGLFREHCEKGQYTETLPEQTKIRDFTVSWVRLLHICTTPGDGAVTASWTFLTFGCGFATISGLDTESGTPCRTWLNRQGQESSQLRFNNTVTMSRLYGISRINCNELFGKCRHCIALPSSQFHGSSKLQTLFAARAPRSPAPRNPIHGKTARFQTMSICSDPFIIASVHHSH